MKRRLLIFIFILGLVFPWSYVDAGTILSSFKYAWSNNVGYINFEDVIVENTALSGYAWSANKGFIKFNLTQGGVFNDGTGNLSGSAWGEQLGYIDFNNVSINGSTGKFSGTATGTLVGTITFDCPNYCNVQTDWRQTVVVPTGGGGGSGGGGGGGALYTQNEEEEEVEEEEVVEEEVVEEEVVEEEVVEEEVVEEEVVEEEVEASIGEDRTSPAIPDIEETESETDKSTYTIEGSGEEGATVFVDGIDSNESVGNNGTFSVEVALTGGGEEDSFSISLKDDAGNVSSGVEVKITGNGETGEEEEVPDVGVAPQVGTISPRLSSENPPLFDIISEPVQASGGSAAPFIVASIISEILLILFTIFIVFRIRKYMVARAVRKEALRRKNHHKNENLQ